MLKIIYLGTPEFAVPTLKILIEHPQEFEVVAVLCQPDRPKGRGKKLEAPPTKELAMAHGITVLQPEKLARAPEIVEEMRRLKPDIIVMVAFGQILKKEVLELAPMGVVNVHGSLLPRLRGAAPINWSIINGDTVTGVTTMLTEAGVDTGPMLLKAEIPITEGMTAAELSQVMSHVGAETLLSTVRQLAEGKLKATPQDDSQATLAPILSKEMGKLDFTKSARDINNLVRGLTPWPGTTTTFRGKPLKIIKTRLHQPKTDAGEKYAPAEAGSLHKTNHNQTILVACGADGRERLELLEVQPESRAKMEARVWVTGAQLEKGDKLGS